MTRRTLRHTALASAAALLLVTGSRGAHAQTDPATGSAQTADALEAVLEQADRVWVEVQRLRGLHAEGEVRRAIRTREELRADVVRLMHEEYTPEELAGMNRLMQTLRLLRPDQNYIELLVDLLEDQVAGFYDQRVQTFYLMREGDLALQLPVMAHELFHAVQDQVWGLENVQGPVAGRVSDIGLARAALIEGDALLVMMQHTLGATVDVLQMPGMAAMLAAGAEAESGNLTVEVPTFMWQQLIYPYTAGFSFVQSVGQSGGWPAVDAVYFDPPRSTEQVLHPERYADRDEPTWLEYGSWEGAGGTILLEDIFGEFVLRTTLHQLVGPLLSSQAIERAAEGWDGDRLRLRTFDGEPDRERLTWLSVWDTEQDAIQFARVASRLGEPLLKGAAELVAEGTHGSAWELVADDGALRVERWGDLVAVVLVRRDATSGALDEARHECDAVFASVVRSRYPDGI